MAEDMWRMEQRTGKINDRSKPILEDTVQIFAPRKREGHGSANETGSGDSAIRSSVLLDGA